jgi:NAD-dependent SIR2 family protein deacetylase
MESTGGTPSLEKEIERAARIILDADAILITAGAGMGVPGNLGTFRGKAAGVWPPLEELNLRFTDLSCPNRFSDDDKYGPGLAWAFWKWRFCAYTGTKPHSGYHLLKKWCDTKKSHFVFTSNIDGHFERAGFEGLVNECHGTVKYMQCTRERQSCPKLNDHWLADVTQIQNLEVDPVTHKVTSKLPSCPGCGGVARPVVMMFGDWLVLDTIMNEQQKRQSAWRQEMKENNYSLCVIEIGAGVAIPTVRYHSEEITRAFKCPLIRINPENPEIERAAKNVEHVSLPGGAELLEHLDLKMKELQEGK